MREEVNLSEALQGSLFEVKHMQPGYTTPKATSPGLKYDKNKPSMELIDPEFLEEMAKVLDFGKSKYSAHNWRGGIQWSRTLGAVLRHTLAYLKGEDLDQETGINHMAHVAVNAMFLVWFAKHRKDFDDRYIDRSNRNGGCALSGISGEKSS